MSHSIPGTWAAWTAMARSRCATIAILLTFVCISAYAGRITSNTDVKASGFMLQVDGKPFVIKGWWPET
jgi:hypothetical protein